MVELIVSPEYLASGEKVLIIDDFLASGATILGLVRLAEAAGAFEAIDDNVIHNSSVGVGETAVMGFTR